MAGVDSRQSGVASGLVNTSQQIGGALGLAALASLAAGRAHTHHPATTPAALTSGFQIAAGIAATAALTAIVLNPEPGPNNPPPAPKPTAPGIHHEA